MGKSNLFREPGIKPHLTEMDSGRSQPDVRSIEAQFEECKHSLEQVIAEHQKCY